jgi:sugar phosphate permease
MRGIAANALVSLNVHVCVGLFGAITSHIAAASPLTCCLGWSCGCIVSTLVCIIAAFLLLLLWSCTKRHSTDQLLHFMVKHGPCQLR